MNIATYLRRRFTYVLCVAKILFYFFLLLSAQLTFAFQFSKSNSYTLQTKWSKDGKEAIQGEYTVGWQLEKDLRFSKGFGSGQGLFCLRMT